MTSYAATAPFESLFAEGHLYRAAVATPRNLVVVLGIWLIFGAMGMGGMTLIGLGLSRSNESFLPLLGLFPLAISIWVIFKTARNYISFHRRVPMAVEHVDGE